MKKALITLAIILMFAPSISYGATNAELETRQIQLLEQIIVLLKARLEELIALKSANAQYGTVGASFLSASTTKATSTPIVKKKHSGGGGGGSSHRGGGSNNIPVTLVLDMQGTGNIFTVTANQTLSPVTLRVTLTNFPNGTLIPTSLILRAKTNDGVGKDIELMREVNTYKYEADMRARLSPGVSFTGEFEIIFPSPTSNKHILYNVFYDGNGVTRNINLENDGAVGDDLNLESSNEDPDAHIISLDKNVNTEATIFAFDLSAEESIGSVNPSHLIIDVAITRAINIDNLVNDFRLEIDGQSFGAESYDGTGNTAVIDFDIDGDVTIDVDTVLTAVLYTDFKQMTPANEGSTIFASISPSNIYTEENIVVDGNVIVGKIHTLRTQGLDLGDVTDGTGSSDSTQVVSGVSTDANYGTMFLTFEVTAFGDNLFVKTGDAVRGVSSTAGVAYVVEDSAGDAVTTGVASVSYDIDGADENNGYFELEEGNTYEMTVTVDSYNPTVTGTYHLQLLTVGFNDSEANATDTEAPSNLSDYESDAVSIQS